MMFETITHDKPLPVLDVSFLNLFDTLTDGVCLYGSDKKIIYANDVLCRMLHLSSEEVQGKSLNDYLRSSHGNILSQLIDSGVKKIENFLIEFRHNMGHNTFYRLWADSYYDLQEGYKGTLIMISEALSLPDSRERFHQTNNDMEKRLCEFQEFAKDDMLIISSLISLQTYKYKSRSSLDFSIDLSRRINALMTIHMLLGKSQDRSLIGLREYLTEIIYSLYKCSCFNPVMPIIDIEEISISFSSARYIGLLVSEIVSNALKHAFPQGSTGSITVTVKTKGPGVLLSIVDDGIGMPDECINKMPSSMGLELVTYLVKQLEGDMEIFQRDGTEFRIYLNK